jgi:hypothetical protein
MSSPSAVEQPLRRLRGLGEIAVNQNSTIILPIPIDLLRPYLDLTDGSGGGYGALAQKSEEERRREEREAQRRYEQTIGEASREVPGQMPDGEANP